MCPGIRPEGSGLGVLPTPLVVLSAGCMRSTLLSFAPNTSFLLLALQKWQLRFFFVVVFFSLLFRICPSHASSYF